MQLCNQFTPTGIPL